MSKYDEAVLEIAECLECAAVGYSDTHLVEVHAYWLKDIAARLKATAGPARDEDRFIRCVHCGCFLAYQGTDADGYEVEACDCRGDPDCDACEKRIEYEHLHARIEELKMINDGHVEVLAGLAKVRDSLYAERNAADARIGELEGLLSTVTRGMLEQLDVWVERFQLGLWTKYNLHVSPNPMDDRCWTGPFRVETGETLPDGSDPRPVVVKQEGDNG